MLSDAIIDIEMQCNKYVRTPKYKYNSIISDSNRDRVLTTA